MGSLRENLQSALALGPRHREKSARSRRLNLDLLLDDQRLVAEEFSAGALDFVLMGYRYQFLFAREWQRFRSGPTRPAELEDLLLFVFAALLTRDRSPASALVSSAVDLARDSFGPGTVGLTNAFLRGVGRNLPALKKEISERPELLLGPELGDRWARHPELLRRLGRQLAERPEPGLWAFDAAGNFSRRQAEEMSGKLQALDPGSWAWMKELSALKPLALLDACAAPGGKLLAYLTLAGAPARVLATDAKSSRLERLRENLRRWDVRVETRLQAWGEDEDLAESFDLILADLPCTGSGTLHTRPDLLGGEPWSARVAKLRPLQEKILGALQKRLTLHGSLYVSLCSVDPEECAGVSRTLGVEPFFSSFDRLSESCEGITGWRLLRSPDKLKGNG